MITPELYIPEEELSEELRQLIPPDDVLLYTSAVAVRKCEFASTLKFGQLAITNRGLAFAVRRKGLKGGLLALRGGPIQEYISFDRVEILRNMGQMVRIRVSPHPREDPSGKPVEYEIAVERSHPYEERASFKERRELFGAFLEQAIFLYRTGQAVPPPIPAQVEPTVTPAQPPARLGGEAPIRTRRPMYCPQCGAFLEDPGRFCDQCGAPLTEE